MATLEKRPTGIGRKPALLVIDASIGFTDPNCALGFNFETEIGAIGRLLERYRELGLPVYFTTIAYANQEQASVWRSKLLGLDLLRAGSKWVDIDPRIAPRSEEAVIAKFWPSAFFETDLKERMRAEGVDTVFITGFTTSGRVRASGWTACRRTFGPS